MSYFEKYQRSRSDYQRLISMKAPDRVAILNKDNVIIGTKLVGGESDPEYFDMIGGKMTETQFEINKVHNQTVFFDKGQNSIWMEEQGDRSKLIEHARELKADGEDGVAPDKTVENLTQEEFERYLTRVMQNRYYVRDSNLRDLMQKMDMRYGQVRSLDFLEDFFMNMFKGTAFKTFFPQEITNEAADSHLMNDLRKRYNIYVEFKQQEGTVPQRKYYTFVDDPNPCHLVNIMKDEFGRDLEDGVDEAGSKVKYAFMNTRELGRGKAGTASLFSYYPGQEGEGQKLQIAVKLMAANQFDLTNNAKYLPLRIVYFADASGSGISRTEKNIRYTFPMNELEKIKENYPHYDRVNIFSTNRPDYRFVALACASDNFSNQTIQHMILENILEQEGIEIDNYIRQFDAMLCWNTRNDFLADRTYIDYLRDGMFWLAKSMAKALDLDAATVDGVNFMEIADMGDLHSFMFDIQKKYFSEVRGIDDLDKLDTTNYRADAVLPTDRELGGDTYYHSITYLLEDMTRQILTTLSVLQHPRHAFVHGDLKTKNVFVKKAFPNDPKNRKFIYKIADYDKSSITYNGVRFYNEGMGVVKLLNTQWGVSSFDASKAEIKLPDDTSSGDILGRLDSAERNVDDISNGDYIAMIFDDQNDDMDRVQILYQLIIKSIKDSSEQQDDNDVPVDYGAGVSADIGSSADRPPTTTTTTTGTSPLGGETWDQVGDEHTSTIDKKEHAIQQLSVQLTERLLKILERYREKIDSYVMFRHIYKHTGVISRFSKDHQIQEDYSTVNSEPDPDNIAPEIGRCIMIMILGSKHVNIDMHYNLNSFWTKLSVAFSGLQNIEMEQLYVRYSPIPFYHTIDMYTLFLSLIQSPMILTYLKYCQRIDRMVALEPMRAAAADRDVDQDVIAMEEKLDNNLFWLSFKELWVDAEDIDTILGYYDYLHKKPTAEDQASIGFILDPVKKNPISLVKNVSEEYWERAWNLNAPHVGYVDWSAIKTKLSLNDETMQKVNLSAGSLLRMPNICLTDRCDSFKMRIHRSGTVFYLNQDMITYNSAGIGEKISAITATGKDTEMAKEIAIRKYGESINSAIVNYLKRSLTDVQELAKAFEFPIQFNIDPDVAKDKIRQKALYKSRTWSHYRLKDIGKTDRADIISSLNTLTTLEEQTVDIFNGVKIQDAKDMMRDLDWLVEFIHADPPDVDTPVFAPKTKSASRDYDILTAINRLIEAHKELQKENSAASDDLITHAGVVIDKLTRNPKLTETRAKILMAKSGVTTNDINSACRTNIYLDAFGNETNWDFCYRTNEEIYEDIRNIKEIKYRTQ
jgi:hypothetical protein